ncbi:MAG: hypothetical protein HKN48_04120 [Flavobacteriaceae bacterium]|nr:hypothetical protein [Flavobacteriaceae bacterium]
MMNENELKDSGWLEQYLLGDLDPSQTAEVEALLSKSSELRAYVAQMEDNLQQLAMENAMDVPSAVKSGLMKSIASKEKPTIPLNEKRTNNSYLAIAASLALLFGVSSFWLYTKVNSLEDDIRLVREQKDALQDDFNDAVANFDEAQKWYEAINDPKAQKFTLEGNDLSPDATLISYVNDEKKSVIVDASGLPELDADHDYQMWADVEGEMINMGVIPKNSEMIAMTYIDNAESLNITIEPAGGNDHPTVERLITNVYLEP